MNLTEIRSKYGLLLIIGGTIVIALTAASLFYIYRPKPKTQKAPASQTETQQETIPSPSTGKLNKVVAPPQNQTVPPDLQQIQQKILNNPIANVNGDIILKTTDSYEVKYVPGPNVFFITIFKNPADSFKKEAQNWFLTFGLQQKDLCNLPIRFLIRDFKLRGQNPNFSSTPDGC